MSKSRRALVVPLGIVAVAVALTACGGGSSSSSSGGNASTTGGSDESAEGSASPVAADGSAEAKLGEEDAATPKVALPQKKAGILNISRATESGARAETVATEALDAIGWSHVSCNAAGNPSKMSSCGETLLNEGVEVLYLVAIPPEAIQPTLKRAASEGIPVLSFAGGNPSSPLLAAQYDGNEPLQGKLLGEYLVERLKEEGNEEEFEVLEFTSFTTFASARQKTFEQAIKADPNIKVVSEKEVNPENSVAGTEEATSALLNQYPHLGAIVAFWDDALAGAASAVSQKYPGAEYPDRPLLIGFDAIKTNQPWIARGIINAVIDVDSNAPAWAMVDQTAGYFARKTPIDEHNPEYPGITLVEPQLITKENLPPEGTYVPPPFEPEAFFGAKWKAEYGK